MLRFLLDGPDRQDLEEILGPLGEWTVPPEEETCVYTPHRPELLDSVKTVTRVGERWRVCDPSLREITLEVSKDELCARLDAPDTDGRASSLAKEIRLNGVEG